MTYECVFTKNTAPLTSQLFRISRRSIAKSFVTDAAAVARIRASAIDIENANRPPVETNARAKLLSSPAVAANFAIVS